jgi:hypothetical protein
MRAFLPALIKSLQRGTGKAREVKGPGFYSGQELVDAHLLPKKVAEIPSGAPRDEFSRNVSL